MSGTIASVLDDVEVVEVDTKTAPVLVAYKIPQSRRLSVRPSPPSLFRLVEMRFESLNAANDSDKMIPPWRDRCGLVGKLQLLAPSADTGAFMGQFCLPDGHINQQQTMDGLVEGQITIPVTTEVADLIVNSGALTGMDNVAWARTEGGVIVEFIIYIEVEG